MLEEALSVAVLPLQIVLEEVLILKTGNGFTKMLKLAESMQPFASCPITEYVAFVAGRMLMLLPVAPVFH
jgi:hypothetical protein